MSNGRNKVCPRCGAVALVNATRCRECGRQFRTQFAGSSGTAVSRRGPYDNAGQSARGKKIGPSTSLLPTEFHRPSDEHPEFAAPKGMPPTYHDLPNIDVLRKDLSESMSKIGSPTAEPFAQLFLADAPGSPLAFEPPTLPNLMPFISTAGPQYADPSAEEVDESAHLIDWTNPETFLGPTPGSSTALVHTPSSETSLVEREDVVPVSTEYNRAVADFALKVRPVQAGSVEVDIDEYNYLSIDDLLPYDKAIRPVNKWLRYGLNALLIGCGISIITSTADYMHLRPTNFLGQALVVLSPSKKIASASLPLVAAGDVVVDQDGDFVKPVKVVTHTSVKGLPSGVFSQLSSGDQTVGVVDDGVAPENVAVLPVDGSQDQQDDSDNDGQLPKAFTQTDYPLVRFKLHHTHGHLRYN